MNEKWIKDIHDRMSHYETDAPEGLWESIQQEMASRVTPRQGKERGQASKPKHTLVIPMWARRTLGVAAAVAVVFLVGRQYLHNGESAASQQPRLAPPYAVKGQSAAMLGSTNVGNEAARHAEASLRQEADASLLAYSQPQASSPYTLCGHAAETSALSVSEEIDRQVYTDPDALNAAPADKPTAEGKQKPLPSRQQKSSSAFYASASASHSVSSPSSAYTLSAYTSGGIGNNQNTSGAPFVASSMSDNIQSDAVYDEYANLNNFMSKALESKRTVKHKQPIRVGISVAYSLTPRLAIESGVSYAQLATDIKDGTSDDYSVAEQRLYYVGIPLNLKYKLYDSKHVALYTSAGVLAEQCVKGTMETTAVKENTPSTPKRENTPGKPLQFSVNAAAGAQLNVSRNIGIYAEPGLSYYFDDRSSLNTIYKEKPLSFNLNVGVRVNIK